MNFLLVFPFNENNNKSKSAQAIINCLCGCYVCVFCVQFESNLQRKQFPLSTRKLKETTSNGKTISSSKGADLLLNCIKKCNFLSSQRVPWRYSLSNYISSAKAIINLKNIHGYYFLLFKLILNGFEFISKGID